MTPQKVGNDGLVLSRDSRARIGIGASIKEPLDETNNCVGRANIAFERLSHQLLQHSTLFGDRLSAASLADGDALGELLSEVGPEVARSTRPAARARERGMTFLEVVVVLAILSTLVGMTAPAAFRRVRAARVAKARAELDTVRKMLEHLRGRVSLFSEECKQL